MKMKLLFLALGLTAVAGCTTSEEFNRALSVAPAAFEAGWNSVPNYPRESASNFTVVYGIPGRAPMIIAPLGNGQYFVH
jgi:hypothetical protein